MSTEQQESRFDHSRKQWIKAIFWCLVYILFIAWVGNYWWLIGLPAVFDVFITKYIPWTWWKKSKNKTFVAVMGWVDAIVFALVAVYFINTYIFQNYQIPTSSLEKTLLVGDFLFVSKASYGPRVPNTPLSFPLVQHTFPILNTKSFIENPQWEYKRLKGFDSIERNDIVVFNFPTGDTVAINKQNPDYYTCCYNEGYAAIKYANPDANPTYNECLNVGRGIVKSNKKTYGEIVYRPVDRRENYVKRCVAIPGDRLQIVNNQIYINGEKQMEIPGIQLYYYVQTDGTQISKALQDELEISNEDFNFFPSVPKEFADKKGLTEGLPVYHLPLTKQMHDKLLAKTFVKKIVVTGNLDFGLSDNTFPLGNTYGWTRDNYGPIYIPKKGSALKLNSFNLPIYERIITVYEHNTLEIKDGKYFINGKETQYYKFKMDYYWMMGDNRHNSADSRYWGFVPEDHVVGRPVLVWLSLNKDKGLFDGWIRFNRFFKNAEN